ncbi:hypothetical protein GF068_16100 [Polyangium spumosum]|uniref:HNH nuclease domain-containing protein n=2 Tax=Polyangium spumosum TaxID=889282 RepID=A0A6N7PMN5_9BACT|nr:hypothetical protein [Polyangium spumosum]
MGELQGWGGQGGRKSEILLSMVVRRAPQGRRPQLVAWFAAGAGRSHLPGVQHATRGTTVPAGRYDPKTGQCTLTRAVVPVRFADQFSSGEESNRPAERRLVSGEVFLRNPAVRQRVLMRAQGKCEWCGEPGFAMADGRVFLETHHVIPLAAGGPDTIANVVALCPNHHREAHHGAKRQEMSDKLLARLSTFGAS